jgi:hypothetical protein
MPCGANKLGKEAQNKYKVCLPDVALAKAGTMKYELGTMNYEV